MYTLIGAIASLGMIAAVLVISFGFALAIEKFVRGGLFRFMYLRAMQSRQAGTAKV